MYAEGRRGSPGEDAVRARQTGHTRYTDAGSCSHGAIHNPSRSPGHAVLLFNRSDGANSRSSHDIVRIGVQIIIIISGLVALLSPIRTNGVFTVSAVRFGPSLNS